MLTFSLTRAIKLTAACACAAALSSCVNSSGIGDSSGASSAEHQAANLLRAREIAEEPTGNFYYARRYHVEKTRFWGYLREPRQPWSKAKLVVMNESVLRQPDRLPESGPWNARLGFDNNYEYRIAGSYTGQKIYEPSSNLFLPEFKATGYTRTKTKGGWLFSPRERYDPKRVTLLNKSVKPIR